MNSTPIITLIIEIDDDPFIQNKMNVKIVQFNVSILYLYVFIVRYIF